MHATIGSPNLPDFPCEQVITELTGSGSKPEYAPTVQLSYTDSQTNTLVTLDLLENTGGGCFGSCGGLTCSEGCGTSACNLSCGDEVCIQVCPDYEFTFFNSSPYEFRVTLKSEGDNISRVIGSIVNSVWPFDRENMSTTLTISNRLGTISTQEVLFIRCQELLYFDHIQYIDFEYWIGTNVPIVMTIPTPGFREPVGLSVNNFSE